MTSKAFLAALSEAAAHAVPDDDLVRHTLLRARSGLLDDRQLAVVLFRARSRAWDEARREGLAAASGIPPMLARVLNQYSSFAGVPTARFDVFYDADGYKSSVGRVGGCGGNPQVQAGPQCWSGCGKAGSAPDAFG